jgi:hypothetical protein
MSIYEQGGIYFCTLQLTASKAAIFVPAVPLPPEMMAPACPILLPGGAVTPAMKDTTGLALAPFRNGRIGDVVALVGRLLT